MDPGPSTPPRTQQNRPTHLRVASSMPLERAISASSLRGWFTSGGTSKAAVGQGGQLLFSSPNTPRGSGPASFESSVLLEPEGAQDRPATPVAVAIPSAVTDMDQAEREPLLDASGKRLDGVVKRDYGGVSAASTAPSSIAAKVGQHQRRRTKIFQRTRYYIPAIDWIPKYSWSLLGGDVLAGFTVACMLIPQSISYATSLAKVSPAAGLFSASIPGIVYAFLGTSRQLNVAPEAALSLLVGQVIDDVIHQRSEHPSPEEVEQIGIAVGTIITLQTGLFTFFLGFFRLGFLDVVLGRALLRGFITAVAIVIMIEQLIPMLGLVELAHQIGPTTTIEKAMFLIENIPGAHKLTAIISFVSLAILVVVRSAKKWVRERYGSKYSEGKGARMRQVIGMIPEVLVTVIMSTVLSDMFDWEGDGVDVLGKVPILLGKHFVNFPFIHANARYLRRTTTTALLCSVMGFLDSIVAAKQNGSRFGHTISPNRELVALGAANVAGSFIPGTLPAYGSITRSRINGDVGARTQMSSVVCSALVLVATFSLMGLMEGLPRCVLASVIGLIVFSLLAETPHDVHYYIKMRAWTDLALMTLTFLLSVLWDVEIGIVVSLVISLMLVVRRSSKTRMTILGRLPGTDRWKPISENPDAQEDIPGALIVRIREHSLDFANTAQLKERLRRLELYGIEASHPSDDPSRQQASVIVFHMADVEDCDASAVQIFYELLEGYKHRSVGLFVTHLRPRPHAMFEKAGIEALLGPDAFCNDVREAVARLQRGAGSDGGP